MKGIPMTEVEILSIVKSLKLKNSTVYEGISSRILKHCVHIINIQSYLYLFTGFGIYPERMTYSTVKPIYKKGDITDMTNYRPVLLLTTFAKTIEKAMFSRIN
jgi:hypothetical protein